MKLRITRLLSPVTLAALLGSIVPIAQADDDPKSTNASVKVEVKEGKGKALITGPDGKIQEFEFSGYPADLLTEVFPSELWTAIKEELGEIGLDPERIDEIWRDVRDKVQPHGSIPHFAHPPSIDGGIHFEGSTGLASSEPLVLGNSEYFIGVGCDPVDAAVKAQLNLSHGLTVRTVNEGHPAANAGVEQFDILLNANGKDLHELSDLIEVVKEAGKEHQKIAIELLRSGEKRTVEMLPIQRSLNIPTQQLHRVHPGIVIPPSFGHDPDGLRELKEEMKELKDQIRDLRENLLNQHSHDLKPEDEGSIEGEQTD